MKQATWNWLYCQSTIKHTHTHTHTPHTPHTHTHTTHTTPTHTHAPHTHRTYTHTHHTYTHTHAHTYTHVHLLAMCKCCERNLRLWYQVTSTHKEDNRRLFIQQPSAVEESLYPNTLLPRSEEVGLGCRTITKRNEPKEINGAERLNTLELSTQNSIT